MRRNSYESGTIPRTSTHDILDDSVFKDGPAWNLLGASQDAAENSARLATLRNRLLTQGHHLPLSLIQAEINDTDDDSTGYESPMSKGSPVGTKIPPIRVSFKEVGVGGGTVTSDRWYPCVTDAPRSIQVIDYTTKGKAKDVSRLAKEYETTEPIESPLGGPINTPLPRHYKRAFPSFEPYARRQSRAALTAPSIKESLMQHAPWVPKKVPMQPPPPPAEPSSTIVINHQSISGTMLQNVLAELQMNTVLTLVDLSYSHVGDEGVIALSESLMCHKGIRRIKLVGCCIGDAGASALAGLLHETRAVELDLRWNGICRDGSYLLKKKIDYTTLTSLKLGAPKQDFVLRFEEGERLGIKINQVAMIQEVFADSPAARAVPYVEEEDEEEEEEEEEPADKEPRLIPGMVICAVNYKRVKTDRDVKDAVEDAEDEVILTVRSNRVPHKILNRIDEKLEQDEDEEEEEEAEADE